jgi:hypothetical protein
MQYQLHGDFTPITETKGTLFAPEREVEIATEQKVGTGFYLAPNVPTPFKGTIFARATSGHAVLNVVDVTLPTS